MNPFAPSDPGTADVLGLITAVVTAAALLWLGARWLLDPFDSRQRTVVGWFLAALCGVTLAFGWLAIGVAPLRSVFVSDAVGYHQVIGELSAGFPSLASPTQWGDRAVFFYGMAVAQTVFGLNGYVSVVVNALLVGITMLAVIDATRLLFGTRVATATAAVVALLPATSFWAATPLREILVLCLTVITVDACVRVVQQPRLTWWLLAVVPAVLMVRTRDFQVIPLILVIGTAIAFVVFDRSGAGVRRVVSHPAAVVVVCLVALGLTVAIGPQLHRVAMAGAERAQTQTSNLQRIANSPTTPTLHRDNPTTPGELVARTPGALVSYLWGPGPTATAPRLMVVEAVPLWLLTPFVVLGLGLAVRSRRREAWLLIAAAAPAAFIGAITLGNYGIISRIRLTTWMLLLPFAGWGVLQVYEWWQRARTSSPSDQADASARSSS